MPALCISLLYVLVYSVPYQFSDYVLTLLFTRRPFGVEAEYFVQLFFEIDRKQIAPPSTEVLLCKMFKEQNISFTKVQLRCLIP